VTSHPGRPVSAPNIRSDKPVLLFLVDVHRGERAPCAQCQLGRSCAPIRRQPSPHLFIIGCVLAGIHQIWPVGIPIVAVSQLWRCSTREDCCVDLTAGSVLLRNRRSLQRRAPSKHVGPQRPVPCSPPLHRAFTHGRHRPGPSIERVSCCPIAARSAIGVHPPWLTVRGQAQKVAHFATPMPLRKATLL